MVTAVALVLLVLVSFCLYLLWQKDSQRILALQSQAERAHTTATLAILSAISDHLEALEATQRQTSNHLAETVALFDPLVNSLAQALQARMDTINEDFGSLRTRVEVGAGRRTLSL